MYCNNCGTQNPDNGTFCGKCGNRLTPAQGQPQPCLTVAAPVRKTNGMAIAALVLGISSFIVVITSIPAIIFGAVALNQIKKDPSQEGKGMAIAGLICGAVVTFLMVCAILFFIFFIAIASSTTTSDFWVSALPILH